MLTTQQAPLDCTDFCAGWCNFSSTQAIPCSEASSTLIIGMR